MSDIKKTANKVRSKLKSEYLPVMLLWSSAHCPPLGRGCSRQGALLPCVLLHASTAQHSPFIPHDQKCRVALGCHLSPVLAAPGV